MQIDNINLNNLRVFECVYKTGCMTTAAKELHLTQSGVSQHIKGLEQTLDVKLFDRINKRIIPTDSGKKLYEKTRPALFQLEEAILELAENDNQMSGRMNIGMPIEYGNNMLVPLLAQIGRDFPGLEFSLTMEYASKLNDRLLDGSIDFAFVDDYEMDRRIEVKKVGEEVFELCGTKEYFRGKPAPRLQKSYFEALDYVAYQQGEPVLRRWFSHHLKRKNLDLKIRAQVMDVQAVARFIVNSLGVGILPDHLVAKLKKQYGYPLQTLKGSAKPLKNSISLAYLSERSHAPYVHFVMEQLKIRLS